MGEICMTDDLISRQAAIDVLEERLQANGYSNVALVSELNRSIGYLMCLPSAEPTQTNASNTLNALEEVIAAHEKIGYDRGRADGYAEALEAEPRWIPASERLPEEPFGCIVSYHGFMLTPHGEREYDAIYPELLGYDGSGWNNSEGECVDNMIDVTAWMPLPEPWKGADDE